MADRDVTFRRIRGRIVPIKRKKTPASHKVAAAGVGASVGGAATLVFSGKKIMKSGTFSKSLPIEMGGEITKRYAKTLKKLGTTVQYSEDILGTRFPPQVPEGLKSFFFPQTNTIGVGKKIPMEIFEHELGHAISTKKKYSFNRVNSAILRNFAPDLQETRKLKIYNNTIRPFIELGSEAEASREAMKMARKRFGKNTAGIKKARRALGFAYGSYLGRAGTTAGLGLVGVAALMKANEWRKKRGTNETTR